MERGPLVPPIVSKSPVVANRVERGKCGHDPPAGNARIVYGIRNVSTLAPPEYLPTVDTRDPGPSADVWDRLWSSEPSDAKDATRLERERRGVRWHLILKRLESAFSATEGLRVIELGAGRGDLSLLLAERGAEVTLLDRSPKALELARRRFVRAGRAATFLHGDLMDLDPALTERFDVSSSLGVAEHFRGEDRDAVLAAHRRVLRPGGWTIVSVPYAWSVPYRVWKAYLELRGWWPYGMEIPFTAREIRRRARRVGFEAMETHCLGLRDFLRQHRPRRGEAQTIALKARSEAFPPDSHDDGPRWLDERSWLDPLWGPVLLMLARRPATGERAAAETTDRGVKRG